jgi:hypothetical protein
VEQLNVPPSQGRIPNPPIAIRRDEQMLDHAVGGQQLDAIQKQVRIRRKALANGVRQFEPPLPIATAAGVFIRVEQRHEVLNQQREIKRIGVASAVNQARLVERDGLLHRVVANL